MSGRERKIEREKIERKKQRLAEIREEEEKRRREKAEEAEEEAKLNTELFRSLDNTSNGSSLEFANVYFVPSLQNLTCLKIVTPLINKELINVSSLYSEKADEWRETWVLQFQFFKCEIIKRKVTDDIRELNVSRASLQRKLEEFIATLCCEIADWLKICYNNLPIKDDTLSFIMNNIPHCWFSDGTIDQEKSVQLVVKNHDIPPINRFIFACNFCFYEDILNLWELLSNTEKSHLRISSDSLVRNWIPWLESYLNKDWQFCVAWILGTSLWNKNVCVLKRVLGALTPKERSYYLRETLTQSEVSKDVKDFCRSLLTREVQ